MSNEPTEADIEKARKLLTPEMKQALGLYSRKERVSITERGMLRINASTGFGRNKGSSVGRYKASQYTPEGTYGWLTGVPSQVITDPEASTVSVIVTEKVTPEEMVKVNEWINSKAFTIPKEKRATPSTPATPTPTSKPTPKPESETTTPTPETDSSKLSVTQLAQALKTKLQIELKEALTIVKEDRAEAESLLKE